MLPRILTATLLLFLATGAAAEFEIGPLEASEPKLNLELDGRAIWQTTAYDEANDNGRLLESGIFNAGFDLFIEHTSGVSGLISTSTTSPVQDFDSEEFDLDHFVNEAKLNYKKKHTSGNTILLSVGKMRTGTDTSNRETVRDVSGVMGFRISIDTKRLGLIQTWLAKRNLKINNAQITRYNYASDEHFDLGDLSNSDMTAGSITFTDKAPRPTLHAFFVYKRPDTDSGNPRTRTIGAAYMMNDFPRNPQFFGLLSKTKSAHVDLAVYVFSSSIEVGCKSRANFTWSRVLENTHDEEKILYELSLNRPLFKVGSLKFVGTVGYQYVTQTDEPDDQRVFLRVEANAKRSRGSSLQPDCH